MAATEIMNMLLTAVGSRGHYTNCHPR